MSDTEAFLHVEATDQRVEIRFNGVEASSLLSLDAPVVLLAILDDTRGAIQHVTALTARSTDDECSDFASLVYALEPARLVALAAGPGGSALLTDEVRAAVELLGSALVAEMAPGQSFALIGRRGLPPGAAAESLDAHAAHQTTGVPVSQERLMRLRVRADRQGAGFFDGQFRLGPDVQPDDGQWHFTRFDGLGKLVDQASFDLRAIQQGAALAWLRKVQPGQLLAGCAVPAFGPLPDDLRAELAQCGSTATDRLKIGDNWAFAGYRWAPPSAVSECVGRVGSPAEAVLFHMGMPRAGDGYSVALSLNQGAPSGPRVKIAATEVRFVEEEFTTRGPSDGAIYLVAVDDSVGRTMDARMVAVSRSYATPGLRQWLEAVPVGHLVVAHFPPGAVRMLSQQDEELLGSLGSVMAARCDKRESLSIIGRRGARVGTALEVLGTGQAPLSIMHRQQGILRQPPHGPITARLPMQGNECIVSFPQGDTKVAFPPDRTYLRVAVLDLHSRKLIATRDLSPRSDDMDGDAFADWLSRSRQPGTALLAFVSQGPFRPREALHTRLQGLGFAGLDSRQRWLGVSLTPGVGQGGVEWAGTDRQQDLAVSVTPSDPHDPADSFAVRIQTASGRLDALSIDDRSVPIAPGALGTAWVIDGTGHVRRSLSLTDDAPAQVSALQGLRGALDRDGYLLIVASDRVLREARQQMPALLSSWGSALPQIADNDPPACWILLGRPHLGRAAGFEMITRATTCSLLQLPRQQTGKRLLGYAALAVTFVIGVWVWWHMRGYRTGVFTSIASTTPVQRARRPLNRSTYLVAHNAFASSAYGWNDIDAAQALTYEEMFESHGVRGFMLDVWPMTAATPGQATAPDLRLRHGSTHDLLNNPDLPFAAAVEEFVRLLNNHPDELIFVFIESPPDWLPDGLSNQAFIDAIPAAGRDLVAWLDNRYPANTTGPAITTAAGTDDVWPMYETLVRDNRRLIFFVDRDRGNPSTLQHVHPFLWRFVRESSFGDVMSGAHSEVKERDQSKRQGAGADGRTALLLNHFPPVPFLQDFSANETSINSLFMLKLRTLGALRLFGRAPNFVAVDHVHLGEAPAFVEGLNRLWASAAADATNGNPWSVDRWAEVIKVVL